MGDCPVHPRDGWRGDQTAADRAVPAGGPAVHRDFGHLPRCLGPDAGRQRAERDRAGNERLARADLHGVGGAGQRRRTDHAELRVGHERRPRAGRRTKPAGPRIATPARRGDTTGRARGQGALELSAVHHPLVRQPRHRPDRAGRLRLAHGAAGTAAPARRGPGPAVRHRTRHANLDRPGQAPELRPVAGRRERRHPGAERTGVVGHHRRPAQHQGPGHCRHRGGDRAAVVDRAVRQHRAACQHRRRHRAAEGRGAHRAGRPDLRHLGAAQRQPLHRHWCAAFPHGQRAGHGQGGAGCAWKSCQSSSRRA